MAFLNNRAGVQVRTQQEILYSRYRSARHNLLLVVIFSLINIFLLVINANTYFLFSAFVPFVLVGRGMYECGLYPAEVYGPYYSEAQFLNMSFMVFCCVIAAIILGLYLLFWFLLKKPRVTWMIVGLVFFLIDTAALLLLGGIANNIMDILFHGWVIVSLIMGIVSYFKLKKLPAEPAPEVVVETVDAPVEETME